MFVHEFQEFEYVTQANRVVYARSRARTLLFIQTKKEQEKVELFHRFSSLCLFLSIGRVSDCHCSYMALYLAGYLNVQNILPVLWKMKNDHFTMWHFRRIIYIRNYISIYQNDKCQNDASHSHVCLIIRDVCACIFCDRTKKARAQWAKERVSEWVYRARTISIDVNSRCLILWLLLLLFKR